MVNVCYTFVFVVTANIDQILVSRTAHVYRKCDQRTCAANADIVSTLHFKTKLKRQWLGRWGDKRPAIIPMAFPRDGLFVKVRIPQVKAPRVPTKFLLDCILARITHYISMGPLPMAPM